MNAEERAKWIEFMTTHCKLRGIEGLNFLCLKKFDRRFFNVLYKSRLLGQIWRGADKDLVISAILVGINRIQSEPAPIYKGYYHTNVACLEFEDPQIRILNGIGDGKYKLKVYPSGKQIPADFTTIFRKLDGGLVVGNNSSVVFNGSVSVYRNSSATFIIQEFCQKAYDEIQSQIFLSSNLRRSIDG